VRVFTVLRSGGDFRLEHAHALDRMLAEHLPGVERVCLSDLEAAPNGLPLVHGWPGWWSKMELCRPDIAGPLLFFDLDTVILADVSAMVADTSRSIVLRDLYRGRRNPHALGSGVMLLSETDRALVWAEWLKLVRSGRRPRGDQDVFERVLSRRVAFWQDTHPGMLQGYKSEVRGNGGRPAEGTAVVVFHGRPRPWSCGHEWAQAPFRVGPA
jgi:hypothetical protein